MGYFIIKKIEKGINMDTSPEEKAKIKEKN